MIIALPVPAKVSYDSGKKVSFRDISAQLGDGYVQVAQQGINSRYDTWNVTWGALTLTEKNTVVGVLDTVGSWSMLSWKPCFETVTKNFRMSKEGYTLQPLGKSGLYTISCQLIQAYDYA